MTTPLNYNTPMLKRGSPRPVSPPSPPMKKICVRTAPFDESICLPLLSDFEDARDSTSGRLPSLAPRMSGFMEFSSFKSLSIPGRRRTMTTVNSSNPSFPEAKAEYAFCA